MLPGQVIVGPGAVRVSWRVTVKLHVPPVCVPQLTTVTPAGKTEPDGGLHIAVGRISAVPRSSRSCVGHHSAALSDVLADRIRTVNRASRGRARNGCLKSR